MTCIKITDWRTISSLKNTNTTYTWYDMAHLVNNQRKQLSGHHKITVTFTFNLFPTLQHTVELNVMKHF